MLVCVVMMSILRQWCSCCTSIGVINVDRFNCASATGFRKVCLPFNVLGMVELLRIRSRDLVLHVTGLENTSLLMNS